LVRSGWSCRNTESFSEEKKKDIQFDIITG